MCRLDFKCYHVTTCWSLTSSISQHYCESCRAPRVRTFIKRTRVQGTGWFTQKKQTNLSGHCGSEHPVNGWIFGIILNAMTNGREGEGDMDGQFFFNGALGLSLGAKLVSTYDRPSYSSIIFRLFPGGDEKKKCAAFSTNRLEVLQGTNACL